MNPDTIKRYIRKEFSGWWMISMIGAAVVLLPVLFIFFSIFTEPNENWYQIQQYLLRNYITNSVILVGLTSLLTAFIGVTLAWLIAAYDFPLKKYFRWGLILPIAIPPYIGAYTYRTMLSYTGVVQSTLRNEFHYQVDPDFLAVSSLRGAVFIFTIFLFPYVYMITRPFLENQSTAYFENARLLGRKPLAIFLKVILPLSRPAIVGGALLTVYEVLSDYGVTSYFGIHTIATAIFQTWFGMYDVDSALKLASWLMVAVIGVFLFERLLRKGRHYHLSTKSRPLTPMKLTGIKAGIATLYCSIIFLLGFLIPVVQLISWSILTFESIWNDSFFTLMTQTLYVATLSTIIILVIVVVVANVCRSQSAFSYTLSKIITSGYSIPGAIIAIGVLALFITLDNWLAPVYSSMGLGKAPLILSMSIAMLIFGNVIRFMATGYNAVEVGYEKMGLKFTEASRTLGLGKTRTFFKVDLPLIKGALFSGFVLTFVEICKELPLALLLRPFNFETLATKTFQYAKDERIHEASISSLLIIAISILSVIVFQMIERREKQ